MTLNSGPGQPTTAQELADTRPPAFTPVRADQVRPGAFILGCIDAERTVHTFTPDASFTRTLATRDAGKDGWWRHTFTDGTVYEYPGFQLLAVTGHGQPKTARELADTLIIEYAHLHKATRCEGEGWGDAVIRAVQLAYDLDYDTATEHVAETAGDALAWQG